MASTAGYCSRLDEGSYQTPSLVVTSPQVPFHPSPPPSTSDSNLAVLPLLRNERRLRESKDSRTVTGLIVDHVSSFLLYFLYPYCNKLLYTYIYMYLQTLGAIFYRAKLSILHTLLSRIFASIECSLFLYSWKTFFPCFLFSEVWQGNNDTSILAGKFFEADKNRGECERGMAVARRSLVRIINSESECWEISRVVRRGIDHREGNFRFLMSFLFSICLNSVDLFVDSIRRIKINKT